MSELSEKEKALVKLALHQLGEHFDTARIFVTRHIPGEDRTLAWTCGAGNYYAQQGQVQEWLLRMETSSADEESEEREGET